MIVKISKKQFDYLSYSLSEEQELLRLELKKVSQENQFVLIEIDEETADEVYSGTKGILQTNGRYLRESLLMEPDGGLKVESIWEGNKLITFKLLGGR